MLFLEQELDSAKQENKLLRDTIAIKNNQRADGRGGFVSQGGKDIYEIEGALFEAQQTIQDLKRKLELEEEKTVDFI